MALQLLDLPSELILACLAQLPTDDIRTCLKCGNLLLSEIILKSVSMRYRFEQERAGVEENPDRTPGPVISDRLMELLAIEANWLNFTPVNTHTVTLDFQAAGIYDLASEFYLVGDTADPIISLCTGIKYIHTSAGSQWQRIDVGSPTLDFGTALEEHDLIAMVTYTPKIGNSQMASLDVMLLKFSTGAPHPLAAKPTLHIHDVQIIRGRPGLSIEIVGENLALSALYWNDERRDMDTFHLYNWKTGVAKMAPPTVCNTGITFLSEQLLIVPSTLDASLDIFHIPPSETEELPQFLHSFILPALKDGHALLTFQCRGEPNPRSALARPGTAKFSPRPADSILLFSFDIGTHDGVSQHMFVASRARLAAVLAESDAQYGSGGDVPWAAWGPRCTRWLDAAAWSMHYITVACGQRLVAIAHDAPLEPARISLLDFNPVHVKAQRAVEAVDGARVWVVEADADIDAAPGGWAEPFAEPVCSELPYVQTVSKELFDYGAVIVNYENIIGIRFGERSAETLEILHFG
ncbi:hypothetical protein B0H11DRAFT_469874 [Mycena galericulata]|nr:hypothetical protein B0H11DRAFT_469874 [Mycena galericulata]